MTTLPSVIPQPPTKPLVGNVPDIGMESPVQSIMKLSEQYGRVFRLSFPDRTVTIIGAHELAADACDEARFDRADPAPALGGNTVTGMPVEVALLATSVELRAGVAVRPRPPLDLPALRRHPGLAPARRVWA